MHWLDAPSSEASSAAIEPLYGDDELVEPPPAHAPLGGAGRSAAAGTVGLLVLRTHCEYPALAKAATRDGFRILVHAKAPAVATPESSSVSASARAAGSRHGARRQHQHGGRQAGVGEARHGVPHRLPRLRRPPQRRAFSTDVHRVIRLTRMSEDGVIRRSQACGGVPRCVRLHQHLRRHRPHLPHRQRSACGGEQPPRAVAGVRPHLPHRQRAQLAVGGVRPQAIRRDRVVRGCAPGPRLRAAVLRQGGEGAGATRQGVGAGRRAAAVPAGPARRRGRRRRRKGHDAGHGFQGQQHGARLRRRQDRWVPGSVPGGDRLSSAASRSSRESGGLAGAGGVKLVVVLGNCSTFCILRQKCLQGIGRPVGLVLSPARVVWSVVGVHDGRFDDLGLPAVGFPRPISAYDEYGITRCRRGKAFEATTLCSIPGYEV